MKLQGKKIMILGGIPHMLEIVIQSKLWGMYTIVCDYDEASPAKTIADSYYHISTTDIDSLVKIGIKENIDGVFNAFEDLNTWSALSICERLNLPFYATEKQLRITSDKLLFKEMCRECGLPVTEQFALTEPDVFKAAGKLHFPVIIKPTDNYGSKGITICKNEFELSDAFKKALDFSRQRKVIVEHFYEGDGVEFYYTIINGIPYLTAITDRYVFAQDDQAPPLPTATIFPSKYMQQFMDVYNDKIIEFIRHLEIRNGVILFQCVRHNDSLYFYEMAYRLTGEKHYQIIKRETGVDLLKMMMTLSIYGKADVTELPSEITCNTMSACNLAVLLKKGTIRQIRGLDEIAGIPELISFVQTLKEGDEVKTTGNYGQMCLRFNFCADNKEKLSEMIDLINQKLIILSDKHEDMILTKFKGCNI